MSSSNGGSAFPVVPPTDAAGYPYPEAGMTLRDYFAAHASENDISHYFDRIQGVARVVNRPDGGRQVLTDKPEGARQTARYLYADAMLNARAQ